MIHCYILYSSSKNKYYVCYTQASLDERISKHNAGFYDKAYSSFVSDWVLYLQIECENINQAIKIEKHIKRMKSKVYIENLKKYPEIIESLLKKYNST